MITFCCVDCKIKDNKLNYDTASMQTFIENHFGIMNQISDYIGISNEDNKELTDLVLASIF